MLLFVHTSVETRFLYNSKAVLLQSSRTFPEVPMVQRAALRAIWKGSIGRSPHRPSRPKKVFFYFFFNPSFCWIWLLFFSPSLHCTLSPSCSTQPPPTKFWRRVLHIPLYPPAPLPHPAISAIAVKPCHKPLTFVFVSLLLGFAPRNFGFPISVLTQ